MLSTHKDLACFTESPGGEITKPMHSSTTRIICLTHNRSSSFRPKQLPAVPRLTFIPIAKASIFNTSTSKYSRKTIWQPYSYHFPTFFLPFSQKNHMAAFSIPSPPRIPLDSTSHHGHDPRRGRCHWTRVHDDSSGGGSVKDENDGQKWMQTKCCVYRYYIYIFIDWGRYIYHLLCPIFILKIQKRMNNMII